MAKPILACYVYKDTDIEKLIESIKHEGDTYRKLHTGF